MKHRVCLLLASASALVLILLSIPAAAQPVQRGFGLGMETNLLSATAPNGSILFVYDIGLVRIDALFGLGYGEGERVSFTVGGRFHYVLHSTASSDFSIGFAGLVNHGRTGEGRFGNGATRGAIEAVSQIRFFVVENVAALGSLGLGVGFGDGGVTLGIGGQLSGTFGLAYFF